MLTGLEGFAGKASWSALSAWVKHVIGGRTQITPLLKNEWMRLKFWPTPVH
jgi:hypothetical protein